MTKKVDPQRRDYLLRQIGRAEELAVEHETKAEEWRNEKARRERLFKNYLLTGTEGE